MDTQFTGFGLLQFNPAAAWTIDTTPAAISTADLTAGIYGFAASDKIDLTNLAFTAGEAASFSNGVLTISDGGTTLLSSNFAGISTGETFSLSSDGSGGTDITVACYRCGTRIRTIHGEAPIEALDVGDIIPTLAGELQVIRLIGRRSYTGTYAEGNRDVLPVRIRWGALANGLPTRDLWVLPGHAMYLGGTLIAARDLVNGQTIIQEQSVPEVSYFHLEFAAHAVIFAEGAPSESFVDDANREMSDNSSEFHRLYPHAVRKPARYCAPRVDAGWELERMRRQLRSNANTAAPLVAVPPSLRRAGPLSVGTSGP